MDIENPLRFIDMQKHIAENPCEVTIMVNHARRETREKW